jgi:hypothetical protein
LSSALRAAAKRPWLKSPDGGSVSLAIAVFSGRIGRGLKAKRTMMQRRIIPTVQRRSKMAAFSRMMAVIETITDMQ